MNPLALLKKKKKPPVCSAVIVAAGSSQRMGSDKLMKKLGAMPVLARTILAFENCPLVDEIIIVTRRDRLEEIADLCHKNGLHKVRQVVSGGATRMESALAGVSAARHGAAFLAAQKYRAAAPAIPSTDTLKAVDARGFIVGTVDRESIRRVQTPQVFEGDLIKGALTKAVKDGLTLTDDCSAMDRMGVKTILVEGDPTNIKITTPDDLVTAEAIVNARGDYHANRVWV